MSLSKIVLIIIYLLMMKGIVSIMMVAVVLGGSIPCIEIEGSILAKADDCSVSRVDSNVLSWGLRIIFKDEAEHGSDNWFNLLADIEHPRLPYFPVGSKCESKYGKYYGGQSVLINCTQGFEDLPVGYVNQMIFLEDSISPLGVGTKIPLSMQENQLTVE